MTDEQRQTIQLPLDGILRAHYLVESQRAGSPRTTLGEIDTKAKGAAYCILQLVGRGDVRAIGFESTEELQSFLIAGVPDA